MNDSNLTQHPCANKCSEFKAEQCNHCLISSYSEESSRSNFSIGDVVVLKESSSNKLFTIENLNSDLVILSDRDDCIRVVNINQVRSATVAEAQAKRRLHVCEILSDDDIKYHTSPHLNVVNHDADYEKHLNCALRAQGEV